MPQSTTLNFYQRRYCELRAAGMKGTDALKKIDADAGIKPRTTDKAYTVKVARLNALPQVIALLAELDRTAAERAGVTIEGILTDLVQIKNRCMQGERVRDAYGKETGEWQFREQGALKALELLGKHLKMFVDRSEVTGKDGGPIETKEMGDLELARRILFDLGTAERKKQGKT